MNKLMLLIAYCAVPNLIDVIANDDGTCKIFYMSDEGTKVIDCKSTTYEFAVSKIGYLDSFAERLFSLQNNAHEKIL